MSDQKIIKMLEDEELDAVSGGVASAGSSVKCLMSTPLYKSNPAGNNFRSGTETLDTVQTGATVKLYEYGARFCKVLYNGKIGWAETAQLEVK